MNTRDLDPTLAATTPKPEKPDSPATETATIKRPPSKLSASTEAFIAQMAENLRTHDPENPKGRLRKQP